jgi:1-deoxy-D-xylulose-5-phosphate synthase
MVIMAPSDENECRQMLYTGYMLDQPAAVRYPRGGGPGVAVEQQMQALPLGKAEIRRKGRNIAILAFGSMLTVALDIGNQIDATVVNMRFVKPLDKELILRMASEHHLLVTLEENVVQGGAGSAVNELLCEHGVSTRIINHGLPDRAIPHGSREDMLRDAGLTRAGILSFIESRQSAGKVTGTLKSA